VRAAQAEYHRAYRAAVAAPADPAKISALLAVFAEGSPGRRDMADRMRSLVDRGLAGRPGPDGYYVVQKVEVGGGEPGGRAGGRQRGAAAGFGEHGRHVVVGPAEVAVAPGGCQQPGQCRDRVGAGDERREDQPFGVAGQQRGQAGADQ
jgi:hypothetical protein